MGIVWVFTIIIKGKRNFFEIFNTHLKIDKILFLTYVIW